MSGEDEGDLDLDGAVERQHGHADGRTHVLTCVAEGREVGDTTTLADTAVMSIISAQVK